MRQATIPALYRAAPHTATLVHPVPSDSTGTIVGNRRYRGTATIYNSDPKYTDVLYINIELKMSLYFAT